MKRMDMARIKSRDTIPELIVRKYLFKAGYRYRLHKKELPGRPDLVMPKFKVVIFIHGCFWHQHKGCKLGKMPKNNLDYWKPKLNRNVERDEQVRKMVEELGWRVIVVWECKLYEKGVDLYLRKLIKKIEDK